MWHGAVATPCQRRQSPCQLRHTHIFDKPTFWSYAALPTAVLNSGDCSWMNTASLSSRHPNSVGATQGLNAA